jgi:predicted RNA-binding protein with TRAM domain
VPADGSAGVTVTFPSAFTATPSSVQVTIVTTTPGLFLLSPQASALTKNGFVITVVGGAPGSTVSISYRAEAVSSIASNGVQSGVVPSVPADGSTSVLVTFPTPYLSAVSGVNVALASNLPGAVLSVQASLPTANGFTVTVTGGPPGSTVAVAYSVQAPGNGDTITFYYSTLGTVLVNPTDTPGIPAQYHMALVYRVLSDYWDRKGDPGQSDRYLKKYEAMVVKAKAFTYDTNRATQPTTSADEFGFGNALDASLNGGW